MVDVLAFEAKDGSFEAYLFGPAASSAYRDHVGIWTSPAPPITPEALADAFVRISDAEAEAMNWEVVRALTSPEPQQPRLMPEQLLAAAKEYLRRCDEAKARDIARRAIRQASEGAKADLDALTFGSKAWFAEFVRRFNDQVLKGNPDLPASDEQSARRGGPPS
jgi:hypothetical protein